MNQEVKDKLDLLCRRFDCTYTQFITSVIMETIDFAQQKKVFDFVDKDDHFYSKVENNINQFARIANGEKQISESVLKEFNSLLVELKNISNEKNTITKKIYEELIRS